MKLLDVVLYLSREVELPAKRSFFANPLDLPATDGHNYPICLLPILPLRMVKRTRLPVFPICSPKKRLISSGKCF